MALAQDLIEMSSESCFLVAEAQLRLILHRAGTQNQEGQPRGDNTARWSELLKKLEARLSAANALAVSFENTTKIDPTHLCATPGCLVLEPAESRCGRCKTVCYCSQVCQSRYVPAITWVLLWVQVFFFWTYADRSLYRLLFVQPLEVP